MALKRQLVITGIGTDVGKTVVSAIFAEALEAAYWKPVQAGDLENSDSIKIQRWTTKTEVLPEAFRLNEPMSPHAAAALDGIEIHAAHLHLPETDRSLIIEGAGGLMVPLNDEGLTYADVFHRWMLPVVVVSRHYLGSINHTLLTVEVLTKRGIPIEGLVFVGSENQATERIIVSQTGLPVIARIPMTEEVNATFISEQATLLAELMKQEMHGA